MVFCHFLKQIERSVSIILGILGNLVHFRHSFIPQNPPSIFPNPKSFSLRMQVSCQFLFAIRFGVHDIVLLKRLQLMQQKHQHNTD